MDAATLDAWVDRVITDATIPELPGHFQGKVRDNYDLADGRRIIITTDRLSAFDRVITAIPLKGQVLNQIARFWFDATADLCPNHVIDYPDPNVLVCRRLDMLPVEIIVRDYLAGTTSTSILSLYKAGQREMYGVRLPDGLADNERLPTTIITPTTKADVGEHDEPLAPADIVARGLLSAADWQEVSDYALAVFARGRDMAAKRGLILVDTKYEFGRDRDGRIVLADEIHTPDSSRYWFRESYRRRVEAGERPESFDKDIVRNWVAARCDPYTQPIPPIPRAVVVEAARIYVEVFETITGQTLAPPDPAVPALTRIRAALQKYF